MEEFWIRYWIFIFFLFLVFIVFNAVDTIKEFVLADMILLLIYFLSLYKAEV